MTEKPEPKVNWDQEKARFLEGKTEFEKGYIFTEVLLDPERSTRLDFTQSGVGGTGVKGGNEAEASLYIQDIDLTSIPTGQNPLGEYVGITIEDGNAVFHSLEASGGGFVDIKMLGGDVGIVGIKVGRMLIANKPEVVRLSMVTPTYLLYPNGKKWEPIRLRDLFAKMFPGTPFPELQYDDSGRILAEVDGFPDWGDDITDHDKMIDPHGSRSRNRLRDIVESAVENGGRLRNGLIHLAGRVAARLRRRGNIPVPAPIVSRDTQSNSNDTILSPAVRVSPSAPTPRRTPPVQFDFDATPVSTPRVVTDANATQPMPGIDFENLQLGDVDIPTSQSVPIGEPYSIADLDNLNATQPDNPVVEGGGGGLPEAMRDNVPENMNDAELIRFLEAEILPFITCTYAQASKPHHRFPDKDVWYYTEGTDGKSEFVNHTYPPGDLENEQLLRIVKINERLGEGDQEALNNNVYDYDFGRGVHAKVAFIDPLPPKGKIRARVDRNFLRRLPIVKDISSISGKPFVGDTKINPISDRSKYALALSGGIFDRGVDDAFVYIEIADNGEIEGTTQISSDVDIKILGLLEKYPGKIDQILTKIVNFRGRTNRSNASRMKFTLGSQN